MHLTLHLTRSCNMRCSYCYSPPAAGPGMSVDIARQALELGARLNDGSCGVVLFGGEPLLELDLIRRIVELAKAMQLAGRGRFHFKITTNGWLLDGAALEYIVREGILVAFSFDGVRAAQDAHRVLADGGGTFDVLLPRLRQLLAVKPYSSIIMVVNPDTCGRMAESAAFLLDLGVRYLILSLNYAADWREDHIETLRRQYQRLGRLYVQWTRQGRKFYLSPFEVKLSSHINRDRFDGERCDLGARQISVDPEGYLYPCVQFTRTGPHGRWCVGHVGTGIDAAAMARLRSQAAAPQEPCSRCGLQPRCLHTCQCLNWQTTGSVHRVSPVLCRHEQLLTPIADRVGSILFRRQEPLFIQKHYNDAYPLLSLLDDHLCQASPDDHRCQAPADDHL